jgi:predicted aldo/keto reductase-like oxidoreductase
MTQEAEGISRRDLLRAVSAGALVAGAPIAAYAEQHHRLEERNRVRSIPRKRLGRTNMNVTVIGAGTAGMSDSEALLTAVEKGVNFIDTAPTYGPSERMIGEVLSTCRDQVFLCTKWELTAASKADEFLHSLDESLKRMKAEYVDLVLLHQVDVGPDPNGWSVSVSDDPNDPMNGYLRMKNPELKKAFDIGRKNGKMRHTGVSCHNERRKELLKFAVDTGIFDALLVVLNYATWEQSGVAEVIEHAHKHDVGVIGMKTTQGDIKVPGLNPLVAHIAWGLSKGVDCVINSNVVRNQELQDLAISAASVKLTQEHYDILERYTAATSKEYCRGCAHICQSACPEDVQIADIMRFDMYHRHYGEGHHERARLAYAKLASGERVQELCATCRKCEEACPYGLPIVEKLHYVDRKLG